MADTSRATETRILAINSSVETIADFQKQVQHLYINATKACQIDFDQPIDASSFLLTADTMFEISAPITRLYVKATGASGSLYVLAVRTDK